MADARIVLSAEGIVYVGRGSASVNDWPVGFWEDASRDPGGFARHRRWRGRVTDTREWFAFPTRRELREEFARRFIKEEPGHG